MFKHIITIRITDESPTCELLKLLQPFLPKGHGISVSTKQLKIKEPKIKEPKIKEPKIKEPKIKPETSKIERVEFNNSYKCELTGQQIKQTALYGLRIHETNKTLPGVPIFLLLPSISLPIPQCEELLKKINSSPNRKIQVRKLPRGFTPHQILKWKSNVEVFLEEKDVLLLNDLCLELCGV